jgi:hypothetical protein
MLCAPLPYSEYAIDFQRENVAGGIRVNAVRLLNSETNVEVLHSQCIKRDKPN